MAISLTDWWYNFQHQFDPPVAKGLVPTFEQQYIYVTNNTGGYDTIPLNRYYFATQETAEALRQRYAPSGSIVFIPFGGSGGPNIASANERHIRWGNGVTINAGLLGSFFDLNPEDKFPTVADNAVKREIANRGAV